MKKILTSLAIIIALSSCEKQPVGCGTCKGTGTIDCSSGTCIYRLPILFDDGHFSDVSVSQDTWINTTEGERICF